MRVQNRSKYPTSEVRHLIECGMKGVQTARVAVHVKNTGWGYAGMAYRGVPMASPRSRQSTVDDLVTLRIGPESSFPYDNMRTTARWVEVSEAEYQALPETERQQLRHWSYSDRPSRYQREIRSQHPYGGKSSPLIVAADWREGLVAVAAHEARHVWQHRNHKPASEVDAERFAAKALTRYRASVAA